MRSTLIKASGVFGQWRTRFGRFTAAVLLCASATVTAHGDVTPGFSTSDYVSAGQGMNNLARANDLLAGRTACESSRTGDYSVINFRTAHESSRMHFPGWLPFPATEARNDHNLAMHITGEVEIPEAGNWTFGVKSNGGFHLQIGDESIQRAEFCGGANKLAALNFHEAGRYSVDLTYYEHACRATLELFASQGRFHRYRARGADWHLVGDTANGGLAVTEDTTLLPSTSTDPDGPNDITTPDDITATPSAAVPEPGGLMIVAVAVPWLLSRRWRRHVN